MKIVQTTQAPSEPGIYAGLSNAAYHAGPGVSKSQLDTLAKSPLHYWDQYLNINAPPRTETPAMRFGTAVHAAILEPELFVNWVVMPDVDGRTKEGKAAKMAALEEASARGVEIISAGDHAKVRDIALAFSSQPHVSSLMRDEGHPELSVYWNDPDTGIFCRCRPDWLEPGFVLDLKTTEDASPRAFQRSAYSYRYWVQAAYYLDGLKANGVPVGDFIFAAIEKSSPHVCAGYMASAQFLDAGREEYKRLLRILRQCLDRNVWPGYQENVQFIELPAFASPAVNLDDMPAENAFAMDDKSL